MCCRVLDEEWGGAFSKDERAREEEKKVERREEEMQKGQAGACSTDVHKNYAKSASKARRRNKGQHRGRMIIVCLFGRARRMYGLIRITKFVLFSTINHPLLSSFFFPFAAHATETQSVLLLAPSYFLLSNPDWSFYTYLSLIPMVTILHFYYPVKPICFFCTPSRRSA